MLVICLFSIFVITRQGRTIHKNCPTIIWNIKNKKGFGIINQTGDFILEPSLKLIKDFNENGTAAYQRLDSKLYGLIDTDGNFLTEPKFDLIGKFHNGYAKVSRNYLYGLIDENGKIVRFFCIC